MAFDDPRGRAYVVSRGSSDLAVVDLAKYTVPGRIAVGYRPMALALAPDAKTIAVAETGDDAVRLLDAETLATRTVIATRFAGVLFFLYGFEKNERDNISAKELRLYQRFARELLSFTKKQIVTALAAQVLTEVIR
ncbi:MAG: type II toxin-antitoxin system RelE/ParE family toxin [Acidobacteriota bacterium]